MVFTPSGMTKLVKPVLEKHSPGILSKEFDKQTDVNELQPLNALVKDC